MARVENITGLEAVSTSNTTGKPWSSGACMAAEVSEKDQNYYFGGKQMQNAQPKKTKNNNKQFYKDKAKRKANRQNKKTKQNRTAVLAGMTECCKVQSL